MVKTQDLTIRDQEYTIRRWPADVAEEANKAVEDGDRIKVVFLGTVKPKYESLEAVKAEDWEVVSHLYIDIVEFNNLEPAFLSRLKNSSSPTQPLLVIKKQ